MKIKPIVVNSLLSLVLFTGMIGCKHTENDKKSSRLIASNQQEEWDWNELNYMKTLFCSDRNYEEGTFWYQRKYEDSIDRDRVRLAEEFLMTYPESEHYFEVLKFYFSFLMEPKFLKDSLSKKRAGILIQPPSYRTDKAFYYHQFRSLPFDIEARDKWLKKRDSIAHKFLNSEASKDKKATIEVALLGYDLRKSIEFYEYLFLEKKKEEIQFWQLFDRNFWSGLLFRMDGLIEKYPNYHKWPQLVDQFIATLTKANYSPELARTYWEHFYQLTNKPDMFQKHPVLQKLHTKAGNSLEALKKMESFDKTKPLEMQLVSMDGKKINLEDYRGKVVLLDFWSIRCAPCIQEMPHVRKMYDKYKDKGFEVIGIAAEDEAAKQRIVAITKRQGANWPQVLDKSSAASISYHTLYKISALPTVWLLNKDGEIVDKHARGARLEPLIKKYLDLEEEKQR